MIVRLMGLGQRRIDDALIDELNRLDAAIDEDVRRGDGSEFREHLAAMHRLVQERGQPLPPDELAPSDAVIPPADCTIEELLKLMDPDGLVPGEAPEEAASG